MLTEIGNDALHYINKQFLSHYDAFIDIPKHNRYRGTTVVIKQGYGSATPREELKKKLHLWKLCLRKGMDSNKEKNNEFVTLQWRHNGCDSVSNHQPRECLFSRLMRCRSKKTSKLLVTGLCAGNSPETGEFPAQRASNAEHVSIWWRHHDRSLT